ncbi:MAG TPA: endonuclease III domain-containing protein, partial [Thermoanaerobaculia bacterium]|nr:endonuclease III domain-containing protein [Thermoanaerobaculia bacterium]
LAVPANFVFRATVLSHGWYHLAPFRWDADGKVLRRTEVLAGSAVDLTIVSARDGLAVSAPVALGSHRLALEKRFGRMFQLGVDTSEFVTLTRSSPAHAWVEPSGFGRLLCGATVFEDVVKIIATTNTTWRQTVRMVELLSAKCGRRSAEGNAAFPEPAEVARFSEEELQRDCRLGYRAKSIHALASGVADGSIDLDALGRADGQPAEALFKRYLLLPGIGPYGAAHLLAMEGRHDYIAVDTEFRRFVRDRYHRGRKVSDRSLVRRYNRWGRWKYLAYWAESWEAVAKRLELQKNRGE